MPKTGNAGRKFAAASIVAAGVFLVLAILFFGLDDKSATGRDFIQYWALEQQLARHANPYDAVALLRIERAVGLDKPGVVMSFGPPVAFFFALPLGWVGAKTGLILWMLLLLACLALSVWLLWLLHGRPSSRWHVVGLGFPPALWCLIAGQLGIFFLLDWVLFLFLLRRHPTLAGAALVFLALKPHLFLPCALVLLLWSLSRKQFSVLAGFAAALAVSCGLTLWLDPQVWRQYAQMMRASSIVDTFVPTVSIALRFLLDRHARWIELLPDAAACLWAAWYFLTRRQRWDWAREGLLVLLVSVTFAPYSWYSDQAVLFPAILAGLYGAEHSPRSMGLFATIAGAGLLGFLAQIPMTSAYYIWTAPAWLLWYLYAMRRAGAPAAAMRDSAVEVS